MTAEMALGDWLSHLATLHPKAIELTLDRIHEVAATLGVTSFTAKVVTVGGTNGKGSVIKTLEQIYLQAGYRVAAYTSPHLMHFTERLCIDGSPLTESAWTQVFAKVEEARKEVALTFFEFTTLAALLLCKESQLDLILLEVGLGGRSDAVNIVESDLAVVTNVDIDHVEWLGDNREAIGYEKAGIFRSGKPAVCGDPSPPVSLLQAAEDTNTELYCYQKHYMTVVSDEGWEFCAPDKRYLNLPHPKLLTQNVASALMAIELLGLPVTESALVFALENLELSGRYEVLQNKHAKLIFDVAHNSQATTMLAQKLAKEPRRGKCYAVFGIRKDKNLSEVLAPLLTLVDHWFIATIDTPFALPEKEIACALEKASVKYDACTSIASAIESVLRVCAPEDIVLVFGSFYTVAEAKQILSKSEAAESQKLLQ